MVTLIIEALYALVFLQSLVTYLRRGDPVQRDVTLVFAPLTSLLVLDVIRRVLGVAELPLAVSYVGVTLLLAQPYLTMRLVRTLRPVPRWVVPVTLCIFVVTTVPFYVVGERNIPLVTLGVVIGFCAVQMAAATFLAGEARRRTGAPRARLVLAAAATAVLGLCLLVAGAGDAAGQAGHPLQVASEILALLSGMSYVVAFVPPRWLRRMWAGGAAYRVHRQMASAGADETPTDTWRRFATTVREVSGADTVAVLLPADTGDEMVCAAISGAANGEELMTTAADLHQLLDLAQPVAVPETAESSLLSFARRAGARALIAVPVQLSTPAQGALLLLSRRHPMFVEDDARLFGELGSQAATMAHRGAAAAAIRGLNARLELRVQERTAELRVAQAALEDINHQLEAQNTMLTRSNEELQRFAYVASHDLQEPLRKIISFSGLLMERMPEGLDPDAVMYVDRIVGSAARMKRLIEDLLMFSRVGGRAEVRPVPVDCGLVLRSVLESLAVALAESQALVTHGPLPVILMNRTLTEQLLQNLIGNAVKYRSDAPPRIHVAAERLEEEWRLTVSDNGIGIDVAYSERIFQVFQRLHPRGQYEGTGIGLAVCKRIVESCGGRIGVDSTPGVGSTFWFTLPSAQTEPIQEKSDAGVAHVAS
jgi:signal transduction histidine kinase